MTIEHKFVAGLDDILAVTLECAQCHTRLTMSPDDIRIPKSCRHEGCEAQWISGEPAEVASVTSPHFNLASAIRAIRKQLKKGAAFRVLLEFGGDDPLGPPR